MNGLITEKIKEIVKSYHSVFGVSPEPSWSEFLELRKRAIAEIVVPGDQGLLLDDVKKVEEEPSSQIEKKDADRPISVPSDTVVMEEKSDKPVKIYKVFDSLNPSVTDDEPLVEEDVERGVNNSSYNILRTLKDPWN